MSLNPTYQKKAAREFAEQWQGKGYEKGQSQTFWLSLLSKVLGVEEPDRLIRFEDQVMLDHTSFIDGFIPSTHVLIEQKSLGKDLRAPIKQSDGTLLTPFQQAKRYASELSYSDRPRWIVCCNFEEFLIYDMERPHGEPESILLKDLESEYHRLAFLVDQGNKRIQHEEKVSREAAELIGELHDALLAQYKDPTNPESLRSLNILCVRLVFLMYAEDTEILGQRDRFCKYLASYAKENVREALLTLFKILDTPESERDPYLPEKLLAFPYTNGGLFAEKSIEVPRITPDIVDLIIEKACPYDWSGISPTIFGAMFESTLNPETRRKGGMHYTSIENIHKVIDPLFLDDLLAEFHECSAIPNEKKKTQALLALQDKIAGLTFLDPACGSGNFLTETYISLRRLENDILKVIFKGQGRLGMGDYIKVSINQFYGIEINDFAVSVARTAMWIAEAQMLIETQEIIHEQLDFLPLTANPNIVEGDALRLEWNKVVDPAKLNYIIGNPPFVGYTLQTPSQKESLSLLYRDDKGKPLKNVGKLDFVVGWYFKACQIMKLNPSIQSAFVSTNSIVQGEQVSPTWKPLKDSYGMTINFAYQPFIWNSEANDMARVHVTIIGFSLSKNISPRIFIDGKQPVKANHINFYLLDAPDVFLDSRSIPISNDLPQMNKGSQPTDGGNFFFTAEEKESFLSKEPKAEKFIHRVYGAEEFIKGKERYCLWLVDATPSEIKNMPLVYERVLQVRDMRLASSKEATRRDADRPTLFQEIRQPKTTYVLVPSHTGENRKYIPLGFVSPEVIATNAALVIPDATLYHFGVLTSNVHMAWMRAVCGRLKSDYRYSKEIVYNNFPWPNPTEAQKAKIEATAQFILDARALYPDCSLADLYDEALMPSELRKAHQANDRAVMEAYGLPIKGTTESSCVAHLFRLYSELTKK